MSFSPLGSFVLGDGPEPLTVVVSPEVETQQGGGGGFGHRGEHYLRGFRRQLERAEEARDRTIKEQKAAAKHLRKALERAYYGIADEAPEEAERFAEIAAPRRVKPDLAKFLPPRPSIDWVSFSADLDRVNQLLIEMESQRLASETMAADEEDIELLLLAL